MKKESKQPFFTIWLTGLPCSGKTTIANALAERLNNHLSFKNRKFISLDGDDIRAKLNSDLGFSQKDREENLRRIGHLAQLFNDKELNVICSFVSPNDELRETATKYIKNVFLVFVNCSAETCEKRDVKGMWAKARTGEIKMFTGYSAPFYPPKNPDLTINTEDLGIEECVNILIEELIIKTSHQ